MPRTSKDPRSYTHDGITYSYQSVHKFMKAKYGKAYYCEQDDCPRKSQFFDWANLSGKYSRERSDWKQMCRSCHAKYDFNANRAIALDANRLTGSASKRIPVDQYTLDGTFIKRWGSAYEATIKLNFQNSNIRRSLDSGGQYTAHGFRWIKANTNKSS